MRHRRWLVAIGLLGISSFSFAREAGAQVDLERFAADLEQLTAGEAAELVPRELARAQELLRLARESSQRGEEEQARIIVSLLPLQLRLIREILRAVQREASADSVEARRMERERELLLEREELEQVLERLFAARREERVVE